MIWGLGVLEMMLARRLARQGFAALQVRVETADPDDDRLRNSIIDSRGVELNRAAMDYLTARHGLKEFVLMGNCANANVCFNAALQDPRVTGAILTNPHFNGADKTLLELLALLFRREFWRNRNPGNVRIGKRVSRFLRVATGKLLGRDAVQLRAAALQSGTYHGGNVLLPLDFDQKIRELCGRGTRLLMVCTSQDESHRYYSRAYAGSMEDLKQSGQFSHCVLESKVHVFNDDETAATQRNDTICRWLDSTHSARLRA